MEEKNRSAGRLLVLADTDGNILGGVMPGLGRQGDSPPRPAIVPMSGQMVRSVELPEGVADGQSPEQALAALQHYRLQIERNEGRLVRRSVDEASGFTDP